MKCTHWYLSFEANFHNIWHSYFDLDQSLNAKLEQYYISRLRHTVKIEMAPFMTTKADVGYMLEEDNISCFSLLHIDFYSQSQRGSDTLNPI